MRRRLPRACDKRRRPDPLPWKPPARTPNEVCRRKRRHRTRARALRAAARCAATYGARQLHVYRCDVCNGWHLTSQPRMG